MFKIKVPSENIWSTFRQYSWIMKRCHFNYISTMAALCTLTRQLSQLSPDYKSMYLTKEESSIDKRWYSSIDQRPDVSARFIEYERLPARLQTIRLSTINWKIYHNCSLIWSTIWIKWYCLVMSIVLDHEIVDSRF